MRNKLHTIWVTAITLIALLLSSVPANASLNMPAISTMTEELAIEPNSDSQHVDCSSMVQESEATNSDCQHNDHSGISDHQCCPANCTTGYTLTSDIITTYLQPVRLISFLPDSVTYTASVPQTLYRPPII